MPICLQCKEDKPKASFEYFSEFTPIGPFESNFCFTCRSLAGDNVSEQDREAVAYLRQVGAIQ